MATEVQQRLIEVDAAGPGRQVACRLHLAGGLDPLRYLLFLPEAYLHENERGWPLMVFLHGSGERGSDLDLVKRHGPAMIAETTPTFPFVLVSPQCAEGERWRAGPLIALIDHMAATCRIDRRRIVLTGLSMGGHGVWELAVADPARFAALAPVCGWGDPALAPRLRHIPTWVFHGEQDRIVPVRCAVEMVEALRAAGGDVRFTSYPDVDHDSWTETYAGSLLFNWLLQRRRPE